MTESASSTPGLREQRMRRTRLALCHRARQLTIERGLSGFTVDELCTDVGVSRRTFFNYFPTKEDAVIGHDADGIDEAALAAFTRGDDDAPTLLDALAELAIATVSAWDDEFDAIDPHAIIDREPQLLPRMIGAGQQLEQRVVAAIEAREHLEPGDPLARTAAAVIGALVGRVGHQYFADADTSPVDFATMLRNSVAETRAACAPASAPRP
ncbi:TetR/AcrR family transcriptional regulator [Agromyces aureus]|uniref:HTH tetR-type domain-containing protein n=1 Tax=Agromyces aureus TaxID=453304 RepID=A0A191WCA8_9MICO|nr:TetR/AcrR family transcriptional regulator [Agromyces aureus]ANJ25828.1 hypothetical protein ATC03_02740 [Agromyces aureus]